jgi:hypothetical protein
MNAQLEEVKKNLNDIIDKLKNEMSVLKSNLKKTEQSHLSNVAALNNTHKLDIESHTREMTLELNELRNKLNSKDKEHSVLIEKHAECGKNFKSFQEKAKLRLVKLTDEQSAIMIERDTIKEEYFSFKIEAKNYKDECALFSEKESHLVSELKIAKKNIENLQKNSSDQTKEVESKLKVTETLYNKEVEKSAEHNAQIQNLEKLVATYKNDEKRYSKCLQESTILAESSSEELRNAIKKNELLSSSLSEQVSIEIIERKSLLKTWLKY